LNDTKTLSLLLKYGSKENQAGDSEDSPLGKGCAILHLAIQDRLPLMVQAILESGVKPTNSASQSYDLSHLSRAVRVGDPEIFKMLLNSAGFIPLEEASTLMCSA